MLPKHEPRAHRSPDGAEDSSGTAEIACPGCQLYRSAAALGLSLPLAATVAVVALLVR